MIKDRRSIFQAAQAGKVPGLFRLWSVQYKNKQFGELTYKGQKGSPVRMAWAEVENVAREFGTGLMYR
jgi:hypothetical protein